MRKHHNIETNTKRVKVLAVIFAIISSFMLQTTINADDIELTSNKSRFTLVEMDNSGEMSDISTHTSFSSAKSAMASHKGVNLMIKDENSLSPSKLVALKGGGSAQSYPFRSGKVSTTGQAPNMLAYIFQSPSMSGDRTYIAAHYQMKYIDTIENNSGQLLARIKISGFEGYVDIDKIDLIPYLVLEKGIVWTIGGNEGYYSPSEKPVSMVITPDHYTVRRNSTYKVNEIDFSFYLGWPNSRGGVSSTGIAPNWLPVGKYYSSDGITFYTDVRQSKPVKDDKGKVGRYINYFKFLPLRSKSNITGEEFDNYLKAQGYTSSVYADLGNVFIRNGNEYGVNPLIVYSMANLESAFGTSRLAKDRFNLFGWNAVDSNPDNATAYDGVDEVVNRQMAHNLRGYTSLNDWRFFGYSVGNKGSGFNTMYASDPYWGMKIASMAYRVDRAYGFKDLEVYELGQLANKTAINVRSSSDINSGVLYKTKANLVNQFVTLNKINKEFYQTYSAYPIVDGKVVYYSNSSQEVKIDINKNLAYIHKTLITPVDKIYRKGSTVIPDDQIIPDKPNEGDYTIPYRVTADIGLRVRSSANTSSKILGVLNYDSTVFGKPSVNGWVEINYANQKGYISADYLDDTSKTSYLIGDGNRDGKIDMQDFYKIGFHILGREVMDKDTIKRYDTNEDGIIDMQDYYAISFHILGSKKITKTQGSV